MIKKSQLVHGLKVRDRDEELLDGESYTFIDTAIQPSLPCEECGESTRFMLQLDGSYQNGGPWCRRHTNLRTLVLV